MQPSLNDIQPGDSSYISAPSEELAQDGDDTVLTLPASQITPPCKRNGKCPVGVFGPIEFPDLELLSPAETKISKTSPNLDTTDFGNIDFTTPPAPNVKLVPVKLEPKE